MDVEEEDPVSHQLSYLDGTFQSAAIGIRDTPSGIVGNGKVRVFEGGIEIIAAKKSSTLASLLGFLSFSIVFIATIVFGVKLGLPPKYGAAAVPAAILGAMLGQKLVKPVPFQQLIPWRSIKRLTLEGNNIAFVSKQNPRGLIQFSPIDHVPSWYAHVRQMFQSHGAV